MNPGKASDISKEAHMHRVWTFISVEGFGFLNFMLVSGDTVYLQRMNVDI